MNRTKFNNSLLIRKYFEQEEVFIGMQGAYEVYVPIERCVLCKRGYDEVLLALDHLFSEHYDIIKHDKKKARVN